MGRRGQSIATLGLVVWAEMVAWFNNGTQAEISRCAGAVESYSRSRIPLDVAGSR